ncbi:metallo-beta-lactamase superfamily protein [Mycolicibacterium hassiacum DSM 44199]|uniref:Metallo-beta-lactamase superfamily protein n=1 Tax=Mycolicibacterium hassiacum (strain DSM 44199 / CIP 105218 / JCM 12690 / 3849) TaxID=1122247 RepID=K5B8C2_MYCHD|nr:MBL fold metallo-hydrolase [Mycolicibacterium hassiacum]EKF23443.1 metallo-beta-lactamase superfamily protein [Mycolicibacterium hassiacum DSM 44199]MBX5489313.1 MBL fold metallo-hydrolase [Mycolicibacterium hassiacum]MDA4084736.1 metallo-beta-lactamase [Mycolicibacterium hassiacum DSM 44199]VCT89957.1 hypothetical protein MHAS_01657 [Mycolicibacterium hassiacum DSM 44199]
MNFDWERLADRVFRCRLPFLDVTIGLVWGPGGALLIDTGTTLAEARAIGEDVDALTGTAVSRVLLTHHDFDHVLGVSAFTGAAVYCAPPVQQTMTRRRDEVRAEAVRYGADPSAVDEAMAAWRTPDRLVWSADIDLGDRAVAVRHPGRGHTDHDLIGVVTGAERTVVFCGDLVEESGDPVIDAHSDPAAWPATLDRVLELGGPDAVYVPGHGAAVDAAFVRRQQRWLVER